MTERLYRHPTDRPIAGVAGGLAAWLNIDPSLVRITWVLLSIFSGGIFVLVYIVMMIVVPLAPPGWTPRPRGGGYGPPADGWGATGQTSWGPTAAADGTPTQPPGWGTNTAPTPGPWTAPKRGNAGIVAGVVLVALGVWFLVDQYVSIDWDLLWPLAIMVLGGALIAGALMRGRSA